MAGMRDRLIHDDFGADYETVWDVVCHHLPELKRGIERLLKPWFPKP